MKFSRHSNPITIALALFSLTKKPGYKPLPSGGIVFGRSTSFFQKPPSALCPGALCLLLTSLLLNIHSPAGAQSSLHYSPPPPPEDYGAPTGRSRGGASRNLLCAKYASLRALVPSSPGKELLEEIVWARTVSERPTFWFYVPYRLDANIPVEFVLQDAQNNEISKMTLNLPQTSPGIVKFTLPDTVAPLSINQMYHWYFMVYCHPTTPVFVEGWVERIALEPTLASPIEAATPREQVALYAAHGIWYEAITNLVKLRQRQPEDAELQADWLSLLESVGLQDLATEPIVDCCSADSSPEP